MFKLCNSEIELLSVAGMRPKSPGCRPSPKVKKIIYDASESEDFDREEVATYEEVARLYPRPGLPRPIVLVGPPGVGRNELKRRLMALDVDKFRTPVPSEWTVKWLEELVAQVTSTPLNM